MFNMLIVDDEPIEREGIKLLLRKHKFDVELAEAENGEQALDHLQKHPVDILITDIKMPFMDGLELAERVNQLKMEPLIVIYSAYGEFDYAQRAIRSNVSQYLLKPLREADFVALMRELLEQCRLKREEQIQYEIVWEGYHKSLAYEKEKYLIDLLSGDSGGKSTPQGLTMTAKPVQLILVDFRKRFFDRHLEDFKRLAAEEMACEYELVNLNEYQSVFYMAEDPARTRDAWSLFGNRLTDRVKDTFGLEVSLVIGKAVEIAAQIPDEFNRMEHALDVKFFFDGNLVLFSDEDAAPHPPKPGAVERLTDSLYQHIEGGDMESVKQALTLLFDTLQTAGTFSVLYVKYLCSDIIKKVTRGGSLSEGAEFSKALESLFQAKSLSDLRDTMLQVFGSLRKSGHPSRKETAGNRVIRQVLQVIEENLSSDEISLEFIAEKVYLTPSYLSYLFKKETKQSLVKTITTMRLEKARELIVGTNMKMADISSRVGYSNTSYFGLAFRHHYGLSPAKYRETFHDQIAEKN